MNQLNQSLVLGLAILLAFSCGDAVRAVEAPEGARSPHQGSPMADDQWTVARGVYKGKPMLVRINEALRTLVGDKQHKYQVGIAVPFKRSRADGFPPDDEITGLNEIEDRIAELFKTTEGHLFAIVVTTGGMREFVVYTSNPERARAQFQTLKSKTKSHEIQFMVQEDPEWRVYTSLSSAGS